VEAFFGSLKKKVIKKQICKSRDLATGAIADHIERFYNRSRRHSHLGGVSPEQVEAAHRRRTQGVH
jgi:putative transposase